MAETLRLLRVFLASPGDLRDERVAARDAVKEVNELVARPAGYQVDLIGWEDTISEARRPQAVINDDLDQCDLFIGMLYAKWGTPPDNEGLYTSGFHEEFSRSRARRTETGSPDIKVFFKSVDDARVKDAGPELQKVLDFKKGLIEEKAVLFQSFETPQELARLVRAAISAHIHGLAREQVTASREDFAQAPAHEPPKDAPAAAKVVGDPSPDADFLESIATAMRDDLSGVNPVDVARLRLIAMSINRTGNSDPDLGVHDANLLYADQPHDIYSRSELRGLLDCGLRHIPQENAPLWQWLSRAELENADILPVRTIFGDDSQRVGAFEVMRLLERGPEAGLLPDRDWTVGHWFDESSPSTVKNAALRYLAEQGTLADLVIVEKEVAAANSQTVRGAIEAALEILLRHDESNAARFLLDVSFETLDDVLLVRTLALLKNLETSALNRGLDHRSPAVRAAVLEELGRRDEVDESTLQRAATDDSTPVRLAALKLLDREDSMAIAEVSSILSRPRRTSYLLLSSYRDEQSEQAITALKRKRLMQLSLESVAAVAAGDSADRDIAWMVMVERAFSSFASTLRANIDDRFQTFYADRWGEEGESRRWSAGANALLGVDLTPGETRRRNLLRSAVDIALKHRELADLQRIRGLVDQEAMSFSEADADYLGEMGRFEDIQRLALIGSKTSGGLLVGEKPALEAAAVRAILRLGRSREAELVTLNLPGNILSRVISKMTDTGFSPLPDSVIDSLLRHTHDGVRRATALKVVKTFTQKRARGTLHRYLTSGEQRYYNVILWLDLANAMSARTAKHVAGRALSGGQGKRSPARFYI